MTIFQCAYCEQLLFFENARCTQCEHALGFRFADMRLLTLAAQDTPGLWRDIVRGRLFRRCGNFNEGGCNWLVAAEANEPFCEACRLNRTIPNLGNPEYQRRWQRMEVAKRRLLFSLSRLKLPFAATTSDGKTLAFDFLADPPGNAGTKVMTGHTDGLITVNIAEADDAERERLRTAMGEPYRTLLGHLRHEVGHFFWSLFFGNESARSTFREAFGDETENYLAALKRHYAQGPPPNWQKQYVSAYASAHPWEDWAETWAHYLHIVDTLETAQAFGVQLDPGAGPRELLRQDLAVSPFASAFEELLERWLPLTYTVNSLNRSMGQPDLYPFVIAGPVVGKLRFVHNIIRGHAR